jgi:predicted NUDIX family NTP pyrophosphohydrolase
MSVFDTVRVIIYRVHEKGLEIFLVEPGLVDEAEYWSFPNAVITPDGKTLQSKQIELEPVMDADGVLYKAVAIQGDWHDIPRIRHLIKHDLEFVKTKIKKHLPDAEKGTFFAVKEAFKKVMPQEYQMLKELKDILFEQNAVQNI